jgi:hypothetical protein
MTTENLTASMSAHDRGALEAAAELTSAINTHVNAESAAAIDPTQVCEKYRALRPTLEKILPYIRFIPVVGGPAAAAISGLMTLLDLLCPGS